MQCKIINGIKSNVEDEVNKWLNDNNNYEIKHIVQTQDSVYITLTIFYLNNKEVRKTKIEKINNIN